MNEELDNSAPVGPDPRVERRLAGAQAGPGRSFSRRQRKLVQDRFLEIFAQEGNQGQAAREAGIHRSLPDYWREHDAEFAVRFNLAVVDANDSIKHKIFEQGAGLNATETVVEFDPETGRPTKSRTRSFTYRSTAALLALAKARMPEEFRGPGEVKHSIDQEQMAWLIDVLNRIGLTQDQLDRFFAEVAPAAAQ